MLLDWSFDRPAVLPFRHGNSEGTAHSRISVVCCSPPPSSVSFRACRASAVTSPPANPGKPLHHLVPPNRLLAFSSEIPDHDLTARPVVRTDDQDRKSTRLN